jgi:accessory colonization factor AcfC
MSEKQKQNIELETSTDIYNKKHKEFVKFLQSPEAEEIIK